MQQRDLDGRSRRHQIATRGPAIDQGQRDKLHAHAQRADRVELAPPDEEIHASGSSR
jgi:hypothetical protein